MTLPIKDSNPPIGDGLDPETGGAFKILNYDQYMAPGVMKSFGKQYDVEVQVTPYSNYDEMLAKIRAPGESFDLVFPGPSVLSKMVYTELIQPLNHSYVPNLKNVWPEYQDPWYDLGAQYTVPYTIYGTGVFYRADRVSSVPANGYDLIWDEQYSGKVYLLDDMWEAIGMSMLRNDITTDINTSDPNVVREATSSLIELIDMVKIKYNVNAYSEVPEGTATVHQAWSGDPIAGQYYLPKGETTDVLAYWRPDDPSERVIGSDNIAIPKSATKPVLAHLMINDLLDNEERGLHLLAPRPAGVPVVADVVVVEDHRARQRGEQPAVRRLPPRQCVEMAVLLEVLQLVPRSLLGIAPSFDELAHRLAGLVRIDLVPEEEQQVRPAPLVPRLTLGQAGHEQRIGAQGIDPDVGVSLLVVRDADAARSERHAQRLARLDGRNHRWRKVGVLRLVRRPNPLPVEFDRVRRLRAGLEPGQFHQREVVLMSAEGAGACTVPARDDGDDTGPRSLHPERRGVGVDIPHKRSQDEVRHVSEPTARPERGHTWLPRRLRPASIPGSMLTPPGPGGLLAHACVVSDARPRVGGGEVAGRDPECLSDMLAQCEQMREALRVRTGCEGIDCGARDRSELLGCGRLPFVIGGHLAHPFWSDVGCDSEV